MYMFYIFLSYSYYTPVLALTGTADPVTQKVISSTLAVQDATKFIVSPDRPNLRFEIAT